MCDSNSAYIGLLGVVVGGALTLAKDVFLHRRSESLEARLLCIQVMSLLDRFAADCFHVAGDTGEEEVDGVVRAEFMTPDFNPHSLDVQWKTLPVMVLFRIMDLPRQVSAATNAISQIEETTADPHYSAEYFEERRIKFADLGIEALELSSILRLKSGLPTQSTSGDLTSSLRNRRAKAEQDRQRRTSASSQKFV